MDGSRPSVDAAERAPICGRGRRSTRSSPAGAMVSFRADVQVRIRLGSEAHMETKKWVKRWDIWIAPTPVKPGVFRRKEGGFLVRGRVTDPRTGKMREIRLSLGGLDALGAYNRLQDEMARVRDGLKPEVPHQRMRFTEFAASLFEHKLKTGRIKSAKSRQKWEYMIRLHLAPVFGELYLDAIRRTDIKAWKETMGEMIQAGKLHPGTANDRLAIFGRIITAAAVEFEWERNPVVGIDHFDTSEHPTYTEEEPNALTVDFDCIAVDDGGVQAVVLDLDLAWWRGASARDGAFRGTVAYCALSCARILARSWQGLASTLLSSTYAGLALALSSAP